MQEKDNSYNNSVSFQQNNHENSGKTEHQNERHNTKKEALGPNTRRTGK